MNFDTFRESLTSFARTAEKLRAFAAPNPESSPAPISAPPVPSSPPPPCPGPPLLYFPKVGRGDEVPEIEGFKAIHALCDQDRRAGSSQTAWNLQFADLCLKLGKQLPRVIGSLHDDSNRKDKARAELSQMRKRLKEAGRTDSSRQRRWNTAALKSLQSLVKAHHHLGFSKLEKAGVSDKDFWKKLDKAVAHAQQTNEHAGRGLRRLLGKLVLNQRSINHDCFRVMEKLVQVHSRLHRFQMRQKQEASRGSARAVHQWMAERIQERDALWISTEVLRKRIHSLGGELTAQFNARIDFMAAYARDQARQELAQSVQTMEARIQGLEAKIAQDFLLTTQKVMHQIRNGAYQNLPDYIAAEFAATGNYFEAHNGPHGKAGHVRTEPVYVLLDGDLRSRWHSTNERVIERFWVMNRMPPADKAPKVLDAGCCYSLLALELASNGYEVTGVDGNAYAFQHPRLRTFTCDLCELPFPDATFDTMILLSTIEHVGLGHYGDKTGESKDLVAMKEAQRVLKPGGTLLLTTPFGVRDQNEVHRVYDEQGLATLLQGLKIKECDFAVRRNNHVWERCDDRAYAATMRMTPEGAPGAVALVVAKKI